MAAQTTPRDNVFIPLYGMNKIKFPNWLQVVEVITITEKFAVVGEGCVVYPIVGLDEVTDFSADFTGPDLPPLPSCNPNVDYITAELVALEGRLGLQICWSVVTVRDVEWSITGKKAD